jgi:hypothetical protein
MVSREESTTGRYNHENLSICTCDHSIYGYCALIKTYTLIHIYKIHHYHFLYCKAYTKAYIPYRDAKIASFQKTNLFEAYRHWCMPDTIASIRPLVEDKLGMALSSGTSACKGRIGLNILFIMFKYLLYLNIFNEGKN